MEEGGIINNTQADICCCCLAEKRMAGCMCTELSTSGWELVNCSSRSCMLLAWKLQAFGATGF